MVDRVQLGQVFLLVLRFSLVVVIPPMLHVHLFVYFRPDGILTNDRVGKWNISVCISLTSRKWDSFFVSPCLNAAVCRSRLTSIGLGAEAVNCWWHDVKRLWPHLNQHSRICESNHVFRTDSLHPVLCTALQWTDRLYLTVSYSHLRKLNVSMSTPWRHIGGAEV